MGLAIVPITGIDVAPFQGRPDWKKVAAGGYSFAYVKCTEGTWYRSTTFKEQWEGARDAGLRRGAYAFTRWAETKPRAEAEFFVSKMGELSPDDLDPVADVEAYKKNGEYVWQDPSRTVAWVNEFSARVQELTGREPVLYTGPSYWAKYLLPGRDSLSLTRLRLWVAKYTSKIEIAPMRGASKWDWVIWQHDVAARGVVPGVDARCDVNKFFSTEIADLDFLVTGGK